MSRLKPWETFLAARVITILNGADCVLEHEEPATDTSDTSDNGILLTEAERDCLVSLLCRGVGWTEAAILQEGQRLKAERDALLRANKR